MVVVASPQPNEIDQKKRKQTLERAKANHLSKQLQMRLQYAKLKVEHGWQRQNLNEVENLYFHHSHLRHKRPPVQVDPAAPPVLSGVPDRPSPSPPSEHAPTTDGQPSHPQPAAPLPSSATRPPVDLSDPSLLVRLAHLVHTPTTQTQAPAPATLFPNAFPTTTSAPPAARTTTPVPTAALTYDSFWSTHSSSTRALYRTHTGFMTTAVPGGNVAMLTPGGHAAVMTAEGVYVGGGKSG